MPWERGRSRRVWTRQGKNDAIVKNSSAEKVGSGAETKSSAEGKGEFFRRKWRDSVESSALRAKILPRVVFELVKRMTRSSKEWRDRQKNDTIVKRMTRKIVLIN